MAERDQAAAASGEASAKAAQITEQRDLAQAAAQSARAELRSTEQAAEQATREIQIGAGLTLLSATSSVGDRRRARY